MSEQVTTDDLRGSSPAMSTKDLLLEVYRDMKFVRPAVEALQEAKLPERINAVESWQDKWSGRLAPLSAIAMMILGLILAHMAGLGNVLAH